MAQPAQLETRRNGTPRRSERKVLVPWKRGPTILLVEDDAELRRLIAGTLRRDGYRVVECANGDAAFDWLGDGGVAGVVAK